MSLTFALTGMDPATESELKAAFTEANSRLGSNWQLVPESDADHVVVDMDSMYGPMSWLKLHGAGKSVIGLTVAPRTQADNHLQRPFTADSLFALLSGLGNPGGVTTPAPTPAPIAEPPQAAAPEVASTPLDADQTPAPSAIEAPIAEAPVAKESPEPAEAPIAEAPPVVVEPPPPPRDPVFADWLAPGALPGRHKYTRDNGPVVLIDTDARNYHGPANLKPLTEYFKGTVAAEDFSSLSDADWANEVTSLGDAQPLSRLHWFGALQSGKGELLPGQNPSGQYHMTKWPQTEREFPKHFRIATAMMKGPATPSEIATASNVPEADVADFINASLATGFAEPYVEPVIEPVEPKSRTAGLFGRLRGKS